MTARRSATFPEIKIRPSLADKALFTRAAEADKRSLSAWLIVAAMEKAERQGLTIESATPRTAPKKRGKKDGGR